MLRSEHVIARLSRGQLVPHRLSKEDPRALEVAGELCGLYAGHVGLPRARLEEDLAAREEELGPRLDARRGFRIVRGLSKLLEERSSWTSPTAADRHARRKACRVPLPPPARAGRLSRAGGGRAGCG